MVKVRTMLIERRKYIRLPASIDITYTVPETGNTYNTTTKNISSDGLRFQTLDKGLKESGVIELKLNIPGVVNPIHVKGMVIWKKKMSLEDLSPFDVGLEFTEIEEDNKNTFLKFLCDLIYNISEELKHANRKI